MISKFKANPALYLVISRKEVERLRAILLLEVDKEIPNELKVNSFQVFLKPIFYTSKSEINKPKNIDKDYYFPLKKYRRKFNLLLLKETPLNGHDRKILISERKLKNYQADRSKLTNKFEVHNLSDKPKIQSLTAQYHSKRLRVMQALKYLQNLALSLHNTMKFSNTTVSSQNLKSEDVAKTNYGFSSFSKSSKSTQNITEIFDKNIGHIKFINNDLSIQKSITGQKSEKSILIHPSSNLNNSKLLDRKIFET